MGEPRKRNLLHRHLYITGGRRESKISSPLWQDLLLWNTDSKQRSFSISDFSNIYVMHHVENSKMTSPPSSFAPSLIHYRLHLITPLHFRACRCTKQNYFHTPCKETVCCVPKKTPPLTDFLKDYFKGASRYHF